MSEGPREVYMPSSERRETNSLPAGASQIINVFATAAMMAAYGLVYSTQPPPKPREKEPVKVEQVLTPEEIAINKLSAFATELSGGTFNAVMLAQKLSSRDRCRLFSDWFEKQADPLDTVWSYMVEHRKRWPKEVHEPIRDIADEVKKIDRPLRWWYDMADTPEEIEKYFSQKLKRPGPFRCGPGMAFATRGLDQKEIQRVGVHLIGVIAEFVMRDLKEQDNDEIKAQALIAANALTEALSKARVPPGKDTKKK